MNPKEKLKQLIKRKEGFLQKNPHLKKYQEEIDARLSGLDDPADRLRVISQMMDEQLKLLKKNAVKVNLHLVDNKTVH